MSHAYWNIKTTATVMVILVKVVWTDSVPTYSALDLCNSTLDISNVHIGMLNFSHRLANEGPLQEECTISLLAPTDFQIGLQFTTSHQLMNCVSRVSICGLYCSHNTTLNEEISIPRNIVEISFVTDTTQDTSKNDSVNVILLFYTFTNTDRFGSCSIAHADLLKCPQSARCLNKSLADYLNIYYLCQVPTTTREPSDDPEGLTTYNALTVFVSTLFVVLGFLVIMQFFSRRHMYRKCRECLGLPVSDRDRSRNNSFTDQHTRPEFTLGSTNELPPNYSDLSFTDTASQVTSQRETAVQTEISVQGQTRLSVQGLGNVQIDGSAGRISNSLPPSYSDVVNYEDKYHVHT